MPRPTRAQIEDELVQLRAELEDIHGRIGELLGLAKLHADEVVNVPTNARVPGGPEQKLSAARWAARQQQLREHPSAPR